MDNVDIGIRVLNISMQIEHKLKRYNNGCYNHDVISINPYEVMSKILETECIEKSKNFKTKFNHLKDKNMRSILKEYGENEFNKMKEYFYDILGIKY